MRIKTFIKISTASVPKFISYNRVIFPLRGEPPRTNGSEFRAEANTHAKVEHRKTPQSLRSGEVEKNL